MLVPLHPSIVHFPIAFKNRSANTARNTIMEAQLVKQSCGAVAHGVSYDFCNSSGLNRAKRSRESWKIGYPTETLILIERHETFGNIVVWGSILFFIGWVYFFFKYKNDIQLDRLALAFLLLLFMIVTVSAYTGGQLVYIPRGRHTVD
ncbi:MAG: hypothetical protein CM1200mP10_00940 [Candidatus Neomarinimicrobiota bacterium]|nr:MAG: hypothetical protein CM1200mP10_00940 [Candidatus Neomarinimicrobiota bacterium]